VDIGHGLAVTVGRYQLRYHGPGASDPETLFARSPDEAIKLAQGRVDIDQPVRAMLMADGAVLHVFEVGDAAPGLEQMLASSGIYVIGAGTGGRTAPDRRVCDAPSPPVTSTTSLRETS
jgi:hypothetical protein